MDDMSFEQTRRLRALIANWSDKNLADARSFLESRRELIASRELTNAQLHGFLNVVRNARDVDDITKYITNQTLKAERAGKFKEKMYEFWKALHSRCGMIHTEAAVTAREVDPKWTNQPARTARIFRQLVQKYLQHVIAEKLFLEKNKQADSNASE